MFRADVPTSYVGGGLSWNRDLVVEVPPIAPASLRRGLFIQRHYEFSCEISVTMGSNLVLKAPVLILDWSPIYATLFTTVLPPGSGSLSLDSNTVVEREGSRDAASEADSKPPPRATNTKPAPVTAEKSANDSDEELSLANL